MYENERAKILLIRLEDLNHCAAEALRTFLGIEDFTLHTTNIGKKKQYHTMYKAFLNDLRVPDSYLDMMYNSQYSNHFYSKDEIATFRNKWHSNLNDGTQG